MTRVYLIDETKMELVPRAANLKIKSKVKDKFMVNGEGIILLFRGEST